VQQYVEKPGASPGADVALGRATADAPNSRRLEVSIALVWLLAVALSFWLWSSFRDPAALPASGSLAARALARLGSVPYREPALVARVRATRIAVLATFASLLLVGVLERARVGRAVRRFFTTPTSPLNLAVFRIVVFWQAYQLADFDFVSEVASLPAGLQFPPETGVPGIGPLAALSHWPRHVLTPSQILLAGHVMVLACITAMLGWFSRTSALVVAVLLFYDWGAIQWYGKVDHHHHVLWFALVLAASPCGDALSIDSLLRAWGDGHRGRTEPPGSDLAYAIPLRMCMLLMGVLYFFPGFWKIWRSGFDWFLSDAPFNQIYDKWHMLGAWLPAFRVDRYPLLVHAGALGTILFELSFIFLIFGRRTIYAAALGGVTFHTSLDFLMRHGFETLRNCYVLFVNWHGLLGRIGHRLFPRQSMVVSTAHAATVPAGAPAPARRPHARRGVLGAVLVGGALVLANAAAGARRSQDAWPIACYPLFDGLLPDFRTTLQIRVIREDGSERTVVPDDFRDTLGTRWNHALGRILEKGDEVRRRERLRLLWDVLERYDPSLRGSRVVRFFTVRSWNRPERWHEPPGEPELIWEVTL
jgi:hypothetical protein